MATSLRNAAPLNFVAKGVSDTADATNSGRGAMRAMTNMVPDSTSRGIFVCRPGAIDQVDFSSLIAATFVSQYIPFGNIVYGMVSSGLNPGKDQPFAYDLEAASYLPVSGIEDRNTPTSPPATGDWVPPIMARVGSRILVTHPGFPGDDIKFGWFDISEFFSIVTVEFTSGLPFLFGAPSLIGVQPGHQIGGSAVFPAQTRVKNVFYNTQSVFDFAGNSHGTDIIDGISIPAAIEMYPGKTVTGPGVQPGTTILGTPAGASIQLSQPTTSSVVAGTFRVIGNIPAVFPYAYRGDFTASDKFIANVGITTDLYIGQLIVADPALVLPGTYVVNVSGTTVNLTQPLIGTAANQNFSAIGTVIELTDAPSASGVGPLSLSGGSPSAPLWGAGDTAINPLPSVPVGVEQMNGRAWFAAGDYGIPWSDSLLPCIRTGGNQALTTNNSRPVTAIGPLMLSAPITGGIVQSLIAFQGSASMQQIMGDPSTQNLSMNILPVPTGTLAPNTITTSTLGLIFVSPEGVRYIDFRGRVSDPIGQDGDGVVAPFLAVTEPPIAGPRASRMTAAANGRTLRIDVPNSDEEMVSYWFDLTRRIWTGPHTGAARLVKVWNDTFLIFSATRLVLQLADDTQHPDSVYVENGRAMTYEWETSLLPDTGQMSMNTIIESSVMVALPPGEQVQINFLTETRDVPDGVAVAGLVVPVAIWGQAIWGVTWTGPDSGVIRQRQIPWTVPLVFKQGRVNMRGLSSAGLAIGNLYLRFQVQGNMQEVPQIPPDPMADFLLANDGVTILRDNRIVNLTPG